jgi:hypothetical protein
MLTILPVAGAVLLVVGMLMAVGYCLIEIDADDRRVENRRG